MHLETDLLLLLFVSIGGLRHDVVNFTGQLLTSVGIKLLNELHQDFVAPFLLELVLANLWDTVNDGMDELDLGLLALTVLIQAVLEHIVSEVALDDLVELL